MKLASLAKILLNEVLNEAITLTPEERKTIEAIATKYLPHLNGINLLGSGLQSTNIKDDNETYTEHKDIVIDRIKYKLNDGRTNTLVFKLKIGVPIIRLFTRKEYRGYFQTGIHEGSMHDSMIVISGDFYKLETISKGEINIKKGSDVWKSLVGTLTHEFVHAKDPGANDRPIKSQMQKYSSGNLVDYFGSNVEATAFTSQFLDAITGVSEYWIENSSDMEKVKTYLNYYYDLILEYFQTADTDSIKDPESLGRLSKFFETTGPLPETTKLEKIFKKSIEFLQGLKLMKKINTSFEHVIYAIFWVKETNEPEYRKFLRSLYKFIQVKKQELKDL